MTYREQLQELVLRYTEAHARNCVEKSADSEANFKLHEDRLYQMLDGLKYSAISGAQLPVVPLPGA